MTAALLPERLAQLAEIHLAKGARLSVATRFARFVDVRSADKCWPWRGHRAQSGHGTLRAGGSNAKMVKAHRWVYELLVGPIHDGMCVCHHCDNGWCCNPGHLFLGSVTDNNRDRHAKGRTRGWAGKRGIDHHAFKATDEILSEMRTMRAAGLSQQAIAM